MRVLFIGDVVGKPGRRALRQWLSQLKEEFSPDLVIANVENAAGGFGLTKDVYNELLSLGVDVMTSGNHIWDKKEFVKEMDSFTQVLRPANYPEGVPGRGWLLTHVGETPVAVINLQGRIFMECLDCPFRTADALLKVIGDGVKVRIVDFHAEATAEKSLLAFYLTGRVSAVLGTHTHVQTADERVLDNFTGFITDVGMTGALNSSIGMEFKDVLDRMIYHIPRKFKVAKGPVMLNGVVLDIDEESGKCLKIERLFLREEGQGNGNQDTLW